MSEKTEEPTPRRLERARRDGDAPVSSALMGAVALVVAASLAPGVVRASASAVRSMLVGILAHPDSIPSATFALRTGVALCAPLLLAVAAAAALVGVVQTRALVAPARIAPKLDRLSPAALAKSLFSPQRAFSVARALLTAVVVGWLVVRRLEDRLPDLANATGNLHAAAIAAGSIAGSIVRDAVLVVLALGVVDLVITRRTWLSRLRMTRQEVQREHRESEGDPQLKSARERAHQELLAAATVNAVRDATVVIVNPTRLASALRYREEDDDAPMLVAKGEGELARRIVDAARAYGIPVVQDIPVARALAALQEGDAIPAAMYEAVATILRELESGT
ncbi:MAG TPA: EscU/YscU/HrcU family type III secretion system export apparatus switch protein [Polyangiaceae bacterium]|nr:EscU/YscU/HrcU family type III secretion system export apparatus switch protein [Polyangiaceae bacterium]